MDKEGKRAVMDTITYKIAEIGDVVGGGTPSTSNPDLWGGEIPWISPKDLTGYNSIYISHGENFLTPKGLKSGTKLLPKDTVLFSSRAPIGYIAIASNPICTNQGFKSIICNKDLITPLFLYYYIKANLDYIKLFGTGATFPEISGAAMKKIKIQIPSLPIQQKIASILSTYDTLIENNNRRIRLLEQMAENLYKEWFVRFRFPGHEKVETEKSKYGKVPSTFKFIKMQEAFDYYIGGGWGEEEKSDEFPKEASVIRGTDFPKIWQYDISTCPRRFHKTKNYKARQLEGGDVIMEISGGTSEQPVGRVVLITQELLDRFENGKVICASFCKLIRLQKNIVSPYYFYYWLRFLYDTRIIDRYQLQSTGIINFKFEPFLRKGDIMLPPQNIMEKFAKQVGSLHKEMNKLAQQNTLLTRQRDLLLPRLMSGKLEVKP